MAQGIKLKNHYDSYAKYVARQKQKTLDPERIKKWKGAEWQSKINGFKKVFERNQEFLLSPAVCLGSRTGQEIRALHDLGINAIGIDLVAFPPYTIEGDIHELEFEDASIKFVYTNIFDHALYPEKFVAEMERVCSGHIVLNLQVNNKGDEYSENEITSASDVVDLFKDFVVVESRSIEGQFDGMNWELVMRRKTWPRH